LVTDPPYGVGFKPDWDNQFQGVTIAGDSDTAVRDEILSAWRPKPAVVFGSWKAQKPKDVRALLIWDMGTVGSGDLSMPWFPCVEEIYILGTGYVGTRTSAVLRFVNRKTHHANEKPVELMSALIQKCPPGTILDPFMGSGTTPVAAKALNRHAIGIEIEERYCEIAAVRCGQSVLGLED
jgi:site-specific DNA-methyltransferase (adenine-specific)